mgnify:CR=1 FL=1
MTKTYLDIKQQENTLFEKWMTKENRQPFIKDGVPSPETYTEHDLKILFILKDANFGISEKDLENGSYRKTPHDLRNELKDKPDKWWYKSEISNWCAVISSSTQVWPVNHTEKTSDLFAPFAFMQLKKMAGGSSINDKKLWQFATEDKEEIYAQINIYQPKIIVCCGVGKIVYKTIFQGNEPLQYTPNGIGFWMIENHAINTQTFIINFCHPSARYGKKISGPVSFGLRDAIDYLKQIS